MDIWKWSFVCSCWPLSLLTFTVVSFSGYDWSIVTALSVDGHLHFASRFLVVRERWSIGNSSSAVLWLSNHLKATSVHCCHAHPTRDWILKSLIAMKINWKHLFMCMVAVGVPKLAVCQADLSLQTWIRQESGTNRFLSRIPLQRHWVSAENLRSIARRKSWKCPRILIKVIVSLVPDQRRLSSCCIIPSKTKLFKAFRKRLSKKYFQFAVHTAEFSERAIQAFRGQKVVVFLVD